MKPKPLVQVYKEFDGMWRRDCRRCFQPAWDFQWKDVLRDANEHARSHTAVGFSTTKDSAGGFR